MNRLLIALSPNLYWAIVFVALAAVAFVAERVIDRVYRILLRDRRKW